MMELRSGPRVAVGFDATVVNGAGVAHAATVTNLSLGGVMLSGDRALKQHLCDYPGRDPSRESIEADLECRLPREPTPFACRCRLIYIRRQSQQAFDFGLRFLDIDDVQALRLGRFIARAMGREAEQCTR